MTTYSQRRLQSKSNNHQSIKSMNTLPSFLTHLLLHMHKYKKPQHFLKCCFTYAANAHWNTSLGLFTFHYASVNSSCTQTQPPPRPRRPDPRALAFFLPWMANSWGWELLSCQITGGGDEKRGQIPRPPSTRQHSSLIEQSGKCHFTQFNVWFFVSINVLF